ncbi:hypothetical protein [Micromonospora haikouensis]|uniref:hypothetical protein n=1 Tax=Micromonospora haikouensis TaxID=686309 RepID=UPI003D7139A6
MPASIKRIRDHWKVQSTKKDKGLTLTVTVTAYDNGMVEVDGVPINASPAYDQGHGWLVAAETVVATLVEFRKDAVKRQKDKSKGAPD